MDRVTSLVWRSTLALLAILVVWTLFRGPGQRAVAGSGELEHADQHNECVAGCITDQQICCVGAESWRP